MNTDIPIPGMPNVGPDIRTGPFTQCFAALPASGSFQELELCLCFGVVCGIVEYLQLWDQLFVLFRRLGNYCDQGVFLLWMYCCDKGGK